MHRRIAVHYDSTPASRSVLRKAIEYAQRTGAELHTVVVAEVSLDSYSASKFAYEIDRSKEKAQELSLTAAAVAAEFALKLTSHIAVGPFPDRLIETAREIDADLLMISKSRPRNVIECFMGDSTSVIVKECPMSVMVVCAHEPKSSTDTCKQEQAAAYEQDSTC